MKFLSMVDSVVWYEPIMMRSLGFASIALVVACSSTSDGTTSSGATNTSATSSGQAGGGGMNTAGQGGGGLNSGGAGEAGGAGGGGEQSCLEQGWQAGERYSLKDNCNFCDCQADGSSDCTKRTCAAKGPGCSYGNKSYGYAEKFPASDAINECVCAASGLACTRRQQGLPEEGAILLETLTASCGADLTFTGGHVLAQLPIKDVNADFPYDKTSLFPESLSDTKMRMRIVYDGGFVVCRVPSPTQPAIDIEVVVEWISEDGAFDEGLHTYLRRNNFGFVDAWTTNASAVTHHALDGTYNPNCANAKGMAFSAQVNADGSAEGMIMKICEFDSAVPVGTFFHAP